MELLREMERLHSANALDFEDLRSKIAERKKAFLENLEKMKEKLSGHEALFSSVQRLTDKLPELFDQFKNLVKSLGQKELAGEDSTAEDEGAAEPEDPIEQHEQTVEEEAFGPKADEGAEEVEEEEVRDDAGEAEAKGGSLEEEADALDGSLQDVHDHPNFVEMDDGVLDQLEQEQKQYELWQQDQDRQVGGLKSIDDGLVYNGKRRRNFNDRFIKYLGSDELAGAPEDSRGHLKELNDLFNAREN